MCKKEKQEFLNADFKKNPNNLRALWATINRTKGKIVTKAEEIEGHQYSVEAMAIFYWLRSKLAIKDLHSDRRTIKNGDFRPNPDVELRHTVPIMAIFAAETTKFDKLGSKNRETRV